LGTAVAGSLNVELLTTRLETGMTPIYAKVTAVDGSAVTNATVTFQPMMGMGAMGTMGAPVFGNPMTYSNGMYGCNVVFYPMTPNTPSAWSGTVSIAQSANTVDANFPSLTVDDSGQAQTFQVGGSTYLLSMNFEAAPEVGLNPVVVTLSESPDMMNFTPVSDASFTLQPEMPAMGMGAPDSVNPTLTSDGIYEGQVAFSMPGSWVTTITVNRQNSPFPSPQAVEIATNCCGTMP
jgi:hypothetical protein